MATQRVTIAKIGGRAAEEVGQYFDQWSQARRTGERWAGTYEEWPARCRAEMDRVVAAIRENALVPPVLYFCEYVDTWSMTWELEQLLSPTGDEQYWDSPPADVGCRVASDHHLVDYYPLPDDGTLANRVSRELRTKRIRKQAPQEHRWFLLNALEALTAWDGMVESAVLVVARGDFTGTVLNEKMKEALKVVPDWLKGLQRGRRGSQPRSKPTRPLTMSFPLPPHRRASERDR